MNRIAKTIFVLVFLLAPASALSRPASLEQLPICLITFGPGDDPWEKFGHDCISIGGPDDPEAVAYNWGVFDFGNDLHGHFMFGVHFLQGRLLYSMRAAYTKPLIDEYSAAHRSVTVQQLRLTPSQKLNLIRRLQENDTEQNRYYLYDYFKKNCTTMARDAIDQTIDGRIAATLKPIITDHTYRWHDRRDTADQAWLYAFLDDTLGHEVDRKLTAWEECFLPAYLADDLKLVKVPDENGNLVPFVLDQQQLASGIYQERVAPPAWYFYGFLATGLAGAGLLFLLSSLSHRNWIFSWIFNLMVMGWSFLTGIFGALLTYAWFSNHDAAKWNENWLQDNPLSLALVILAPLAFRLPRVARYCAFVIAGISLVGLIAKVTPWFYQTNGTIIAAALPIHLAVAWVFYHRRENVVLNPNLPALEPKQVELGTA